MSNVSGQKMGRVTAWTKMFEGEADGDPLNSPFELPTFQRDPSSYASNMEGGTPLSAKVEDGGRLLVCREHSGTLELMPLFTDPNATATIQVWGFEPVNPGKVDAATRAYLINVEPDHSVPAQGQPALGMSYNILRDTSGAPQTLEVAPLESRVQQTMAFTTDMHPHWVKDADAYYTGGRVKLDVTGMFAVMVWVTSVTTGELLMLGRYL